jgi:hypothetical protein
MDNEDSIVVTDDVDHPYDPIAKTASINHPFTVTNFSWPGSTGVIHH